MSPTSDGHFEIACLYRLKFNSVEAGIDLNLAYFKIIDACVSLDKDAYGKWFSSVSN